MRTRLHRAQCTHNYYWKHGDGQKTRNCAILGRFPLFTAFSMGTYLLFVDSPVLDSRLSVSFTRPFALLYFQQTIHLHFCGDLLWFLQYHCRSQMNTAKTEEWACTHNKRERLISHWRCKCLLSSLYIWDMCVVAVVALFQMYSHSPSFFFTCIHRSQSSTEH